MENRIRILLLSAVILASGCSYMPWRNDAPEAEPPPPPEAGEAPVVIDPPVERREMETARIDTENSPDATISGWVSCFGDTLAMTIGSSKLTWLTQWLV